MVQSQTVSRSRWFRGLAFGLTLVAGLAASVRNVRGQAAPKEEPPGFLIASEIQLAHLAALTVGAAGQLSVGMLNSLAVLHTGEQQHLWAVEPPFLNKEIKAQVGAGLLALSGFDAQQPALNAMIWAKVGDKLDLWNLLNTDEIHGIPPFMLQCVVDETGIPDPMERDLELDAYYQMLVYASQTSDKAFYAGAQRDLTYRHLFNRPKQCRGKVVYLEGRLRRIERTNAPAILRAAGIKTIYEAWFFVNNSGAAPVCAIFTELPDGLKVGERLNAEAAFAGYSYKKYKYASGVSGQQKREAPLLIGRMPHVLSLPDADVDAKSDPNSQLLPLFLVLVAGTILSTLLLALYFRSNDQRVRQRLALATQQEFVLPPSDENEKNSLEPVTNGRLETTDNQKGSDWPPRSFPSETPPGTSNRV